jgi:hypothetical protein
MELPEFRLNRIAKEIDNPLRNWGVGYTAEVMLQYAKEYHESELKKMRVTDVSVSVCDCTHQQSCKICGSKKGLDGDFWDLTAK